MTFDSTITFIHVVLAIVAVACNASYAIWRASAGQGSAQEAQVLRGIARLDRRVALPTYVLLPVTGLILLLRGPWDLTTPWVATSLGLFVVAAAVTVLGYSPALRAQLVALDAHGPGSPQFVAATRRASAAAGVTALLVVVIGFLMVTKPG